jgi:hypothetical protein
MKESAARTDAVAVPAAAETVDSGTTTAGTEAPEDPVPDMVLARPPPGALHGNPEVKAAAAKVAAMEEATEAATAETTAAATAAMKLQANVAEATAGEVEAADGSAATPAEAATASTSHSPLTSLHTLSSSIVYSFFLYQKSVSQFVFNRKKDHAVYSNRIKKKP